MHPTALLTLALLTLAAPQKGALPERGLSAATANAVLELGGEQQPLVGFEGTTIRYANPAGAASPAGLGAGSALEGVTLGLPLTPGGMAAKWLAGAAGGDGNVQDLRILQPDRAGAEAFVHVLSGARIRSMSLSALDATSRDAPTWSVVLDVAGVAWKLDKAKAPAEGVKTKQTSSGDFRLVIDGLDTSAVTRIEGLRVELTGSASAKSKTAGVQVTPLSVTVAASGVGAWLDWIGGKSATPTTASIELLDASRKNVVTRLRLDGLTVAAATRPGLVQGRPGAPALEVELHCTTLRIE